MAGEGAVRWMFERQGIITLVADGKSKEELELLIIEAGAQDFKEIGSALQVITTPEDLETVKKVLGEKGLVIESASLELVAKEEVAITDKEKEKAQKLFEGLDENDAVQEIYSNLKL